MSFNIPHTSFIAVSEELAKILSFLLNPPPINIKKINSNAKILFKVFRLFDKVALYGDTISPSAKWLVDNYYILDKNFQSIKTNISKKLAKILSPTLELCQVFLQNTDYNFDSEIFYDFIKNYQKQRYIPIEELWALPICLRIVLLQKATNIAMDIEQRSIMRKYVYKIINNFPNQNQNKFLAKYNKLLRSEHFLVSFYYQLREEEKNIVAFNWLQGANKDLNQLSTKVENEQANNTLSIANIIKSIKIIDDLSWNKWLEKVSLVDVYLSEHSEYSLMDARSRGILRRKISHIAKYSSCNELQLAHKIIELIKNNKKKKLVGYYLVDEGEKLLKTLCNYKANFSKKIQQYICKHNVFFMLSMLCLPVLFIEFLIFFQAHSLLILFIILPIAFEFGFGVFNKICSIILPQQMLLSYDFDNFIPNEHSTLVAMPCLLTNNDIIDELINNLEINYLASIKGNLFFALVADYEDSHTPSTNIHKKLLSYAQKRIDDLNNIYTPNEHKFFLFSRELLFNKSEDCYMGWERKRGKLCELNRFLRGDKSTSFLEPKEYIPNVIKYIITLDSDTKLAPNSACDLIGKISYELNQAQFCEKTGEIIKGYTILQPRITTLITDFKNSSLFQTIFSRNSGFDPYISGVSEAYQDLCFQGTYIGKAIYSINSFIKSTEGKLKENLILSHDLLEGSYAKCAFVSDIELLEEYPNNYLSEVNRLERWTRGDWQLLPYIFNYNSKLDNVAIIKMLDNLRRSLLPVSFILCMILSAYSQKHFLLQLVTITGFFASSIISFLSNLLNYNKNIYFVSYIYDCTKSLNNLIIDILIKISLSGHAAFYNMSAIIKALYRLTITHKNLLQWQSYQTTKYKNINFYSFFQAMKWPCLFAIIILCLLYNEIIPKNFILYFCATLWSCAMLVAYFLSRYNSFYNFNKLSKTKHIEFLEIGARIWRFYETFCNEENNFLPIDNFQEYDEPKVAHRTSPTNIGMYLLSIIAAHDFDWIDLNNALNRIKNCFNSIEKMQKYKGHLYNWYNTKTLEPLVPFTISTVDSGNLAGHLIALAGALSCWAKKDNVNVNLKLQAQDLSTQARSLAYNMKFDFLLNKKRELLSIGFDINSQKLMTGDYDMLASESRLSYFFAIAKGDIKPDIWQRLGRFLTCLQGKAALLSWSGSMFEYLMPPLILRESAKTLLGQTNNLIIKTQKLYGKRNKKPWGISEAAFNAFDSNLNYQYSNFGVPELGLQRTLAQNYVVAPYATLMAAQIKPGPALKNLRKLANMGGYGKYGFYDAIDFTANRLASSDYAIVKNYYAHHHGMSLIAIYNLLQNNKMQDYFYKEPAIQAFDSLLQEKALSRVPFSNFKNINNNHDIAQAFCETSDRILYNKSTIIPQFLLLNSGNSSFIINHMAHIYGASIAPIFIINNLKFDNENTTIIFGNNKALFEQNYNDLCVRLNLITITPSEYNYHAVGYGAELSILNHANKPQNVNIKCCLPNSLKLDYIHDNIIFSNKDNAKFFIPQNEYLWNLTKTSKGYNLDYSLQIPAKQKIIFNFWYFKSNDLSTVNYLSQTNSFENELQKSWLRTQTNLFHNSISAKQASNYQKLLSLLLYHKTNHKLRVYINNKNYLYSLRDILNALSFWQNRGFTCELDVINDADADKYTELESQILWLKQTYTDITYIQNNSTNKNCFTLHTQNGDVGEQLDFFKFEV